MKFLEDLAARRRFGIRPGLQTIQTLCAALGDPQRKFKAIHVAGTNGKGAVCAVLDAALRGASGKLRVGRYTSPHLVAVNERFFLDGAPIPDSSLEAAAAEVREALTRRSGGCSEDVTFFEALTAVAFLLFAEARVDYGILECGLGGRLDATNVCDPAVTVITRIGLDHCDWLGDTVEKIAAEKAGIIKSGVPVVLGANEGSVIDVVRRRANELAAPFCYAPDIADESELPDGFSLCGSFNRENAITAIAALKMLGLGMQDGGVVEGLSHIVWPGRFQRIGNLIVDGAHNPPAARALGIALAELFASEPDCAPVCNLVFGACGDKDVAEVLRILAPFVAEGFAVKTGNPRSLSAETVADMMKTAGLPAVPCSSVAEALRLGDRATSRHGRITLVCGSLFLAGEALVALNAYPWRVRFDPSEAR